MTSSLLHAARNEQGLSYLGVEHLQALEARHEPICTTVFEEATHPVHVPHILSLEILFCCLIWSFQISHIKSSGTNKHSPLRPRRNRRGWQRSQLADSHSACRDRLRRPERARVRSLRCDWRLLPTRRSGTPQQTRRRHSFPALGSWPPASPARQLPRYD